eukprot:11781617-Alexandrium_andersonii.AAC.1
MEHAAGLAAKSARVPSTVLQLFGHPHLAAQPALFGWARDEPPVAARLGRVRPRTPGLLKTTNLDVLAPELASKNQGLPGKAKPLIAPFAL